MLYRVSHLTCLLLIYVSLCNSASAQEGAEGNLQIIENAIASCNQDNESVSLKGISELLKKEMEEVQRAHLLYCQGKIYDRLDSVDASIAVLQDAYQLSFAADSLAELTGDIANKIGFLMYEVNDQEQSIHYLTKSLAIRKQAGDELAKAAITYHDLARTYTNSAQTYPEVILYADSAIAIFERLPDPPSQIVRAYMLKGVAEEGLDELRLAKRSYEQAMELSENHPDDQKVVININLNLGNYHLKLDDNSTALDYYNRALQISLNVNGSNHYKSNSIRGNIAIVKSNLKMFDEALETANEVLQSNIEMYGKLDVEVGLSYNNIGGIYSKMKEDEQALVYFRIAESIYTKVLDPLSIDLAINHLHLGESYSRIGQYDQALASYGKTLGIVQEVLGPDHIINAACHYYMANTLADQGKFEQAMEYYELTKEKLGYDPEDLSKLKSKSKAADLHFSIGNSYGIWYDETGEIAHLIAARENFETALDLMWSARKEFENRASGDFLMRKYRTSFQNTLLNIVQLGAGEKADLAEEMFVLIDAVKSNQLRDAVVQKQALKFGNIPVGIIEGEHNLASTIQELNYSLQRLKQYGQDSMEVIANLEVKLNEKREEHSDLLHDLASGFPSYYDLRHSDTHISIEKLRAALAGNSEAVLNYFIDEDYIFLVGLYGDGFVVDSINLKPHFTSQLDSYLQQIKEVGTSFEFDNAKLVYEQVLGQIMERLPSTIQKLTIIPEGKLSYLPFEALPMDDEGTSVNDRYAVRYGYSARLLFPEFKDEVSAAKTVLAIAPSYSGGDFALATLKEDDLLAGLVRAGEYALPGSKREVTNIANVIRTDLCIGSEATEERFKRIAKDYQILHLSMHALVDDQFPLESRLVFENVTDTKDDGLLHAYELYSMDLNADLAVLSACNTGSGKHQIGEGVMSLSRAFTYAGVPSTVMSLWKVPDAATEVIMSAFYKHLSEGQTKSTALRQAKLDYLSGQVLPERRAPFYWAGFVLVGDDSPISINSTYNPIYFYAGLILLLGGLLFIFFRKK